MDTDRQSVKPSFKRQWSQKTKPGQPGRDFGSDDNIPLPLDGWR
jgi:hypothetical protein